ncbi:MBL fold metallo-hydrolase [Haloarchaeobius sp. DT45]|uniref:MBL fold metallo-hydrolase n=1 Tax=Haloarchaeobius sp. DT45 TaxID=3446116 RepID=UPI003F6A6D27
MQDPELLDAALASAGFDWGDNWAVVLTHQNIDHVGGLTAVLEHPGPVVFTPLPTSHSTSRRHHCSSRPTPFTLPIAELTTRSTTSHSPVEFGRSSGR